MSGNVVNLRAFRKRKEKAGREATAQENRITHGRTKVERLHDEQRSQTADRDHDGRRLEPDREPDDEGPLSGPKQA